MGGAATNIVIVGSGQSAGRAMAILRQASPELSLVAIGEEAFAPYERPPLSKTCVGQVDTPLPTFVNKSELYNTDRTQLVLGRSVMDVDRDRHQVLLDDGQLIKYEKLLLATGSRPRMLPMYPPSSLLLYLRTYEDALLLRERLAGAKRLLILGGGAIGTEIASFAAMRGLEVTLIEPAERLLSRSVHWAVADRILDSHLLHGIDVRFGRTAVEFSKDGALLDDGSFIAADVAVAAIGVVPNIELAQRAGLVIDDGIVVDQRFVTNDPDILAAGDVARYFDPYLRRLCRSESWEGANVQARHAAETILGIPQSAPTPPAFWTEQFDDHYQFCGDVLAEDMSFLGSQGKSFVAIFRSEGSIVGVCTKNAPRELRAIAREIRNGLSGDNTSDKEAASPKRRIPIRGMS